MRRLATRTLLCLITAGAWASVSAEPAAAQMRAPVREPAHFIRKFPMSWVELQQRNVVMQQRDYSCGAAALATLTHYFWGENTSEQEFLNAVDKLLTPAEARDRIKNGLTITDLKRAAERVGYDASIGKLSFDELTDSKVPLIVGLTVHLGTEQKEFKHFVVYRGFDGWYVYVADPIRGNIRVPGAQFALEWQKNAVLVVAKRNADPPKVSALSVTVDEVFQGELNRFIVRKALTATPSVVK